MLIVVNMLSTLRLLQAPDLSPLFEKFKEEIKMYNVYLKLKSSCR